MLIKVTGIEGGAYLINPNRIMLIEPYKSRTYKEATTIVFDEANILRVVESFDEILGLIERSDIRGKAD